MGYIHALVAVMAAVIFVASVTMASGALNVMMEAPDWFVWQLRAAIVLDERDLMDAPPFKTCSSLDDGPRCAIKAFGRSCCGSCQFGTCCTGGCTEGGGAGASLSSEEI